MAQRRTEPRSPQLMDRPEPNGQPPRGDPAGIRPRPPESNPAPAGLDFNNLDFNNLDILQAARGFLTRAIALLK